ncbi:cysteine desulfurase NifS [bacterium (candidate division B38) B3_B38]|nr:MAG: cysteine desulfurase NifS [bacterium (candidate division B38) B3_B38]
MKEGIYFDNNATTRTAPEVVEAMRPYFSEHYGNASSLHRFGQRARSAIEEARAKVARFLGAEPEEIVFVSGGTEANNLAIKGVVYTQSKHGKHIITSSIEHHAVGRPCEQLREMGFRITILPVDRYGMVDPEAVLKEITRETILISIMSSNNEIGTIQPIGEIAHIAHEKGILFHTDAVQSAGKQNISVKEWGVDLLTISGHKFHGPKGIGVLYIKKGIKIIPQIYGGDQEVGYRAGTEPVPLIVGLGKACQLASLRIMDRLEYVSQLRNYMEKGIKERVDDIIINGHPSLRLPNTSSISFLYAMGEAIMVQLDVKGIAVSTGSACTSGTEEPSHVLSAIGLAPETAKGTIRFSLSHYNNRKEVDYLLEVLPEIVRNIRELSPLYKKRKNI